MPTGAVRPIVRRVVKRLTGEVQLRRAALVTLLFVAVGAIGAADVYTGPRIGMSLFYLIPVVVASWTVRRDFAYLIAATAAMAWVVAEVISQHDPEIASVWNGFTRLIIFVTIAFLLTRLRRDREDLKRTVDALDVERSRQTALIEALRDPILVVDRDGVVATSNERAADLFGPAPVVGRRLPDLLPFVHPERAGGQRRWLGKVTDQMGGVVEVEVSHGRLSGRAGERASLYVVHDITQHAELSRLREQLLYSVAHELRAPLAVLENALDMMASEYQELSAEEFDRLAASAQRTARRLRVLMEDLLSAGTIQSGRFTVRPEPVLLSEVVQEAVDAVEMSVSERRQRIDVEMADAEIVVSADRRYIRQVLTNLLSNASKYGPEASPIRLQAERRGESAYVEVEDRGRGIPQEQLAGLFQRYYRIRGSSEPGVGLGLAIAKGIVEAHRGEIGVESAEGKGTTVWLTLPLAGAALATSRS